MSGTPGPVRGADVEAALAVAVTQVAEAAVAATAAAPPLAAVASDTSLPAAQSVSIRDIPKAGGGAPPLWQPTHGYLFHAPALSHDALPKGLLAALAASDLNRDPSAPAAVRSTCHTVPPSSCWPT